LSTGLNIRNEIRQAFMEGNAAKALQIAQAAARNDVSSESWRLIQRTVRSAEGALDALFEQHVTLRIAIAASFTVQNLSPYLDVVCLLSGINAKIHVVPYNQFQVEFRNPNSELHQFNPQVTLFLCELPELIGDLDAFQNREAFEESVNDAVGAVADVARVYRIYGKGHFLVHNFIPPSAAPGSVLVNSGLGVMDFHRRVNAALPGTLSEIGETFVVDLDHLAARLGMDAAINHRMKYLARMPLSEGLAQELARRLAVHFRAFCGKTRKCLVMDLDNVMWGGIVGEDGVNGVAIGDDPPGNVYRDIQLAALRLYERGVILAIASKNNSADALAVFDERKEMVLRRENFAAIEIDWGDKASAMRRIAKSLDIGLDSLVFLDDSPTERLLVQTETPEVEVLPFPQDISTLPNQLLRCGWFDSFHITEEDRRRGEMYAERRQRRDAQAEAGDLTSFLESLNLVVEIARAERADIPRVAQLTQRTNQFNLTTRRYTEAEIGMMIEDPTWLVLTLSVRDRFGDEGVVGVSLTRVKGVQADIDTFLMSCRVLGRGIEQAFLAEASRFALQAGATKITSEYIPTKKNEQVKGFYASHGFVETSQVSGVVKYELTPGSSGPVVPQWIQLRSGAEAPAGANV
jgi:FkbH-like protein